jgi:hypothetical protein
VKVQSDSSTETNSPKESLSLYSPLIFIKGAKKFIHDSLIPGFRRGFTVVKITTIMGIVGVAVVYDSCGEWEGIQETLRLRKCSTLIQDWVTPLYIFVYTHLTQKILHCTISKLQFNF